MKKCVYLLLLALCLTACSQKAPKCSDSDVKKLVLDTSKELVEKKMIRSMLEKNMNIFMESLNKNDPDDNKIIAEIIYGRIPKLNDLKASKSSKSAELVKEIEAKCNNMKVESIRTTSKDDIAKKCNCEGDLVVDNEINIPIRYDAQKTDDGKIRVEVSM